MEISDNDFVMICRVCKLKAENMRSIFENDCPRIDEMLMACTTVIVDFGDGLPEGICGQCSEKLSNAYKFKQLCEATDVSLRLYVESKKTKDKSVKVELNQPQSLEEDNVSKAASDNDSIANEVAVSTDNEVNEVGVKGDPEIKPDVNCSSTSSDYIQLLGSNQLLVTCSTCSKCFTTLDGLKCHKRLHTGTLFKCDTCGKEYTRNSHLQRHEAIHGRRKLHVCRICNKTLTRFEHLKRHLITHLKEKPFACKTCNRGFNRAENLANHIHRCKGDFVHLCDICNKGFKRPDSLEVHKLLHDNKKPCLPTLDNLDNIDEHYLEIEYDGPEQTIPPYSDGSIESEEDSEYAQSVCLEPQVNIAEHSDQNNVEQVQLCEISDDANLESVLETDGGVYSNEAEYAELDPIELNDTKSNIEEEMQFYKEQEHYDTASSVSSEYLPKKRVKRKRGRPRKNVAVKRAARVKAAHLHKMKTMPNEPEGEFKCPYSECPEIYNKLSLLDSHIKRHDSMKLYTCTTCNKSFARSNHLKRHMICHSELKPFSCEVCKKRFNRRDHLRQHTKLHTKPQEFECEICKRVFGRADHLLKHKTSKHDIGEKVLGEKKYQCTVCLKCFTTEKYRDIHMKAHMGDKTYTCRICEKFFISKSHLIEHVKFHNENSKNFLCSECGQRFIRNDYLVIHMRRHRGEKPFKCRYCAKGFPRTTDLTVHERYHTGEKTHLCTICGRGFGRAYNLTVHMRTHTGEKPYQCTYCDAAFAQGNDLKAHIRRHTGERFHCEFCSESFLMGYLLTHHKRTVHGLNIVSNIRRLNPVKTSMEKDDPPLTVPLPAPVVPTSVFSVQLQSQLAVAQMLGQHKEGA